MSEITLEQMRQWHPNMELLYEIPKPHKCIKYDCPIQVYCEDEIFDMKGETYFWVINDGKFVSNYISFPCGINAEDKVQIAKDLVDELLSKSDFADLDSELQGKAACEEFENVYKSCDQCPRYKSYEQNKERKDGDCLGAMYSIPYHLNIWDMKDRWNKKYGYNSENHKKHMTRKMVGYMNSYMHVCGNEKEMIKEVLDYGKNHCANKYKRLFK